MEPNTEKVYPPSSYLVAYKDIEFLSREDLRPVRLQLELLKPELIMEEHKIVSTVVVFGSARLLSREEAEKNLADVEKINSRFDLVKTMGDLFKYVIFQGT